VCVELTFPNYAMPTLAGKHSEHKKKDSQHTKGKSSFRSHALPKAHKAHGAHRCKLSLPNRASSFGIIIVMCSSSLSHA
jgi:hypothetical protein